MNYSKLQKIISFIVLFFFFFNSIFSIPSLNFFNKASASWNTFYNLVSILVNKDIYSSIKTDVERYAEDIQWQLENTRVVIVPVPDKAKAFNIASLNEWLYFQWYKVINPSVWFNSKLIGTILIWNINLPVINKNNKSTISIAPYVDFIDKSFIYNHSLWEYIENKDAKNKFTPEIWHWVISPNTWDKQTDIKDIKNFFDKDHDFYTWNNLFKKSDKILNWKKWEELSDNYRPFVFYYDQFREQKSIHYPSYKWYKAYLENKEDINYNRYTKSLANKVQKEVLWAENNEVSWLLSQIVGHKYDSLLKKTNWPDTKKASDISTRFITQKAIKTFIESFNKWMVSDIRTNVHNAWRYNEHTSQVNMDFIPYLVTLIDWIVDKTIIDWDKKITKKIDDLVINWLSRKIAIPVEIDKPALKTYTWTWYNYNWNCINIDRNYLNWVYSADIKTAKDCSIYRGSTFNSWTLVRATRWLDLNLTQKDLNKLRWLWASNCLSVISDWKWWKKLNPADFKWVWWWESPLNMDINSTITGIMKLNYSSPKKAIEPLYDIAWAKKSNLVSLNPSPLNCFDNNLLSYERRWWDLDNWYLWEGFWYTCWLKYRLWDKNIWYWSNKWSCKYDNEKNKNNFSQRFEKFYKNNLPNSLKTIKKCWDTVNIYSKSGDYYTIKRYNTIEWLSWLWTTKSCILWDWIDTYKFKLIPSYIIHKSPTSEELYKEIKSLSVPNLPVDKNRYIDFIDAKWNYEKINYPEFFRLSFINKKDLTLSWIKKSLDDFLEKKDKEINNIISTENPDTLNWIDKKLYNILKTNSKYPSWINLKDYLKNQKKVDVKIWNETKEVDIYDLIVFSIFWNNLKSVSAKYKFIIQNYLSDQTGGNKYNFILPKNKQEYEINYIWAIWNAQNMYIKLDPNEKKTKNPYSNIIKLNSLLDANIFWHKLLPDTNKINTPWNSAWTFKCAPPDWVVLWKWIPAVMCRLKNMLPPKIWLSDWDCWVWLLWEKSDNSMWTTDNKDFENLKKDLDEAKSSACYWDLNKNWINDCLEKKLSWSSLDFKSDSLRYFYWKNWILTVIIKDKNNRRVYIDNNTKVYFKIDKIVDKENNKVVFNSNKQVYKQNLYRDYINFWNFWIQTKAWKATYNFSTWRKDADIYFKTYLKLKDQKTWEENLLLKSEDLKIEIRWDRMFLTSSNKNDNSLDLGWDYAIANDKTNIFLFNKNNSNFDIYNDKIKNWDILFGLSNLNKKWNYINFEFPLNISIKDKNNNLLFREDIKSLKNLKWLISIKKSWFYKLIIRDFKWFKVSKNFEIKPAIASRLNLKLWSNILESNGAVSTDYAVIYDRFNNPVVWDYYDINLKINWDSLVFNANNQKNINFSTIEWFKAFRIKSIDKQWISSIEAEIKKNWKRILFTTKKVNVLKNIDIKVVPIKQLKVWWEDIKMQLKVIDSRWNLISDLNSRVYLHIDKKYWYTTRPYFDIKNWIANINFITSKLAWKDINFKFQIEWFNKIFIKRITILPLKPLKVQIIPTNSKIEASKNSYTTLNIELKDIYWNTVFTDNSTKLNLEILDEYKNIIWSDINKKIVKNWKAYFKIHWTPIPWKAYIKISTTPSLSDNHFSMKGQSPFSKNILDKYWIYRKSWILSKLWKKIFYEFDQDNYKFRFNTKKWLINSSVYKNLNSKDKIKLLSLFDSTNIYKINWVWENAIALETYFFWKASSVDSKKYNSLYTVLLWSNYWDVTKKNYLASWMLFDKNNRSLAVTSLLSTPYKYSDILTINSAWNIKKIVNNSDLSQDIDFNLSVWNFIPYIDLYNNNLSTYIWKILFNFSWNNNIKICNNINCSLDKWKTSIYWVNNSSLYKYEIDNWNLVLKDNYKTKIFSVWKDWKFKLYNNVSFKLSNTPSKNLLFDVLLDWKIISKIWFNFVWANIKTTNSKTVLNWLLKTYKNSIIAYLATPRYWLRNIYNSSNLKTLAIYYNDPFEKKYSLNTFVNQDFDYFANFINKWWIWWKDGNLSLLSFAAWDNVWDSIKKYQSLLTINLWDPVISLKKKKIKKIKWNWYKKFDRTIGSRINKREIDWYRIFDFNNDKKDDLLFINNDNYLTLLENKKIHNHFLDLRKLAYIADLWDDSLVQTWDFSWDWYDDIFFVNNKWNPFILNNHLKDFKRYDLTKEFKLDAKITRVKVFDMDNDWIDDIVTLDDNWTINIFYWNKTDKVPFFTKKTVYSGYWIKINWKIRDDYWLVYFKWVPQKDLAKKNQQIIASDEELQKVISKNLSDPKNSKNVLSEYNKLDPWINQWVLDWLMFVQVPYWYDWNLSKTEELVKAINLNWWSDEMSSDLSLTKDSIKNFVNENSWSIWGISTNYTKQTTFIRSQYSQTLWLKVEKIFTDRNWWNLKSWDIVNVNVKLKNTTSHNINNIAYIEDFPINFSLVDNSIKNSWNLKIKSSWWIGKFLIDWINLKPGESFTINYNLKTRAFKLWYIDVWLFEKWEPWDDKYWDIIYKLSKQNCSQNVDIFRSISKREYEKWIKQPTCNQNKLKLPKKLDNPDKNNNWIPDDIDKLINDTKKWDMTAIKDYSKNKLDNLYKDSDWDGLPDREDSSPNFWNNDSILSWLDQINNKVDEISQWIDKLVQWFWCWFWWGSCLALPMNWAPLAAWWDPTVLGFPVWDWLNVSEWLPIFSMFTWISGPFCAPINTVWPVSPFAYPTWTCWWVMSAWGRLWTYFPTNFFRLFYSPTLTWWQWIAACFWWPAIAMWNSIPPWLSPVVPWWNCIVAAAPLWSCNQDDEDLWDPTSMWNVDYIWWGDNWSWNWFWVINWICNQNWSSSSSKLLPETNQIDLSLVSDYMKYKETWIVSPKLKSWFDNVFNHPNSSWWRWWSLPPGLNGEPLISMDWWNDWLWKVSVDLDLWALKNGNFKDVLNIKNTRIAGFPDFLMDWVTRQIEEIVTKLTDFPTLYIILPDFSSILDTNWIDYISNWVKKAYNKWKEKRDNKDKQIDNKITSLNTRKSNLKCDWKDKLYCESLDNQIANLNRNKSIPWQRQYSWISQAYEFLSSVPIITINPEEVDVNIPWIDEYTLTKTINEWKNSLAQWKQEIKRFEDDVTLWATCSWTPEQIKACKSEKWYKQKISLDASRLVWSLEQNIAILENWKKMPEKLSTLINKKQDRLDQILCNIDTISEFMWWWIWRNWVRFKAWVETYILIKAILKSWQLLADLFIDFDAECHECKNERDDLLHFILKLISMIIPKIPVIQFPKWPDIILDLHNIRLNISIWVPDFKLNKRPIVLPVLPELKLPSVPNVNINLPSLPLLPNFEIPELPDLPTLPKIELPDLPPPPKLPKIFASLEWVIKILKLVAKILCILKKSPFVPEWRSWDLISFLTERSGYLPLDFLDIELPQFSYPFVDAIKVTTWVNFEQNVDFLTEFARNIVKPINSFTNDIVNAFQIDSSAFDFSELTPSDINIWKDKIGYNNSAIEYAKILSLWIMKLVTVLDTKKSETISNNDFIYLVNKSLAKNKYINDARYDELRKTWNDLSKITYSKQDKIIKKALKYNIDKFNTVKSIINNEKTKDKKLKENIYKIFNSKYEKVSKNINSDFDAYNKLLNNYNNITKINAKKLLVWNLDITNNLKQEWNKFISRIKWWISQYKKSFNKKEKLLALNTPIKNSNSSSLNNIKSSKLNSCQLSNRRQIKYKYDWIYVVEDWWAYKLFDYTDKLTWDEVAKPIDFDQDSDKDLLYLVDNNLYLKQNLSKKEIKNYIDLAPLEISISDNKYFNWSKFIESVNNFNETTVSNNNITFWFSSSTNKNIHNYRLELSNRIDKYINLWDSNYIPKKLTKKVIDLISDKDSIWIVNENNNFKISKNIAYFKYIWEVNWVTLISHKFNDITKSLVNNRLASITANNKLYSTNNKIEIYYLDDNIKKQVTLDKYSNISFKKSIKIYKVVWGSLYVDSWIKEVIRWQGNILKYLNMPVLFDTSIIVEDNSKLTSASHIDLKYYDSWEYWIDLRKVDYYRLYDLWVKTDSFGVTLSMSNDYYYSHIYAFSRNIIWTYSKQVLLSPQLAADTWAPDINFNWIIRIPVYQTKTIDFTDYIYDNSWIDNIKDISIEKLNPPRYKVIRSPWKIKIQFWKFDNLFKKKIVVKLVDSNWNESKKEIWFEVYSPIPEIKNYNTDNISWFINENLSWEPINIYRLRWWIITKIHTNDNKTKVNTNLWEYLFKSSINNSLFSQDLYLKNDKLKILDVSGNSWVIKLKQLWYSFIIKIEDNYPIIYIFNDKWIEVYREKILLNKIDKIHIVSDFSKIWNNNWLYFKLDSNKYNYYITPDDIEYNPWVLAIYRKTDVSKTPLFVIFKDGRIKALNNNYKLEYWVYNNHIIYKLIDKHFNRLVWELLLSINNNFIIR